MKRRPCFCCWWVSCAGLSLRRGRGGIYNAGGTLKIASGDISLNKAGNTSSMGMSGGAIYCDSSFAISGGTFTGNFANSGGVFMTYWLVIGKATIPGGSSDKQNGVCFNTTGSPQIDGITGVAPTESQVAKITPGTYSASTQVLSSRLYSYATKFYVFPNGGQSWTIDPSTGKLKM